MTANQRRHVVKTSALVCDARTDRLDADQPRRATVHAIPANSVSARVGSPAVSDVIEKGDLPDL